MHSPPEVQRLLRRQRSVAHRDQLRRLGVLSWAVTRACERGRWVAVGPVVVVADNGDLDVEQLRWVAVLHCGPTAGLAAWTALEAWGVRGFERPDVHVVVPRGTRLAAVPRLPRLVEGGRPRIVVHESRRHAQDDVVRGRGVPRHDAARAVVDAAAWGPSNRAAAGLLAAAVQQGATSPLRVREALETAGRVRRRRLLAAVVGDVEGGQTALSEMDFARLCRRGGLPEPTRQRRRRDVDGRWRYLDVEWVLPGRRVVVEVDGRGHREQARWEDDLLRANDVTLGDGAVVLRYAATLVRSEPEVVLAQLVRALGVVSTSRAPSLVQY